MSTRMILFGTSVFSFFCFMFFSYLVHKNVLTQFDFDMTVRLQDNISRRFDNEFSFFSEIGSFEFMLVALISITVILFIKRKILASISAFVLFVGFHVIELFGKIYVDHPPPPHFLLRSKSLFEFPQFHVRFEYSYPSGHAGRTIFLSTILLILIIFNKRLPLSLKFLFCAIILAYDSLMVVSRVYLGEHWTTDVIGGSLLGMALGLVTGGLVLQKQSSQKEGKKKLAHYGA